MSIATPAQISEIADTTNKSADDPYSGTTAAIPIPASSYLAICAQNTMGSGTPGTGTVSAFSLTWAPQATQIFNPVTGGLYRMSLWTSKATVEIADSTAWTVAFNANTTGCSAFLMVITTGMSGWRQPLTNAADDVDTTGSLAVAMGAPLNTHSRTLLFCGANQGTGGASFTAGTNMTEIDEATHASPGARLGVFWSASAFEQNPSAAPTLDDTEMGAIAIELLGGITPRIMHHRRQMGVS